LELSVIKVLGRLVFHLLSTGTEVMKGIISGNSEESEKEAHLAGKYSQMVGLWIFRCFEMPPSIVKKRIGEEFK